jgi:hypothetical protein
LFARAARARSRLPCIQESRRRPQHFIFNREWYEKHRGKAEYEEFQASFQQLSGSQRAELLNLLSCDPREFFKLPALTKEPQIKSILRFYVPLSKAAEAAIWVKQKKINKLKAIEVPEDELVEDAGLLEDVQPAVGQQRLELRQGASA